MSVHMSSSALFLGNGYQVEFRYLIKLKIGIHGTHIHV